MSTEHESGERLSIEGARTTPLGATNPEQSGERETRSKPGTHQQKEDQAREEPTRSDETPPTQSAQVLSATTKSTPSSDVDIPPSTSVGEQERDRQVIAVSASKGPAAFFNLARKFLATDEMCDLSALEGAIVSAVDAAHLLERSQLATIVRVNTSYVTVEPKRRKQQTKDQEEDTTKDQSQPTDSEIVSGEAMSGSTPSASSATDLKPPAHPSTTQEQTSVQHSGASTARQGTSRSSGRELRRARIVITVQRTESYTRWLQENPLQAIIASEGDADAALENAPRNPPNP